MSTYYNLVCGAHGEMCHAFSDAAGGTCHLIDSDVTTIHFLSAHKKCDLVLMSEHERTDSFTLWTKDNLEEMIKRGDMGSKEGNWIINIRFKMAEERSHWLQEKERIEKDNYAMVEAMRKLIQKYQANE